MTDMTRKTFQTNTRQMGIKKNSTSVYKLDTGGFVEGALSGHSRPLARFRPGSPP